MKFNPTLFSKNTRRFSAVIALLGTVVAFSACTKTETQSPQLVSAVSVTNASPTSNSVDFYIGNQKVNNSAILYGTRLDYVYPAPGTYSGTVTTSGTSKSLYTSNFTLINGAYHSLYILSKVNPANSVDSISYLNVKDDFTTPPAGKARVRFINLSPDAPSYNLEITGDTTAFADRTYKTFTAFKSVNPQTSVVLNLRDKATNAIVASIPNVEFRDQKYYTVWAKGLVTTSVVAQKVTLQVSQHFQ